LVQLLAIFGFMSVILRGATLCFESLLVGGIVFQSVVAPSSYVGWKSVASPSRRLLLFTAIGLTVVQTCFVAMNLVILMQSTDLSLAEVAGANFVIAGALFVMPALILAALAAANRLRPRAISLVLATPILMASVMTSHAASRIDDRLPLVLLTFLHQAATTAWVGGLPYLWIATKRASVPAMAIQTATRFSRLAMICVGLLGFSGVGLGVAYVGSWSALYGTSHGAMVATKAILFGCLLALGGLNYRIVHALQNGAAQPLLTLRRFAEAEIGIGLTVIFVAASLTSQPPAVDLAAGRVSFSDIAARMSPRWPRFTSPDVNALNRPTLNAALERAAGGYASIGSFVPGGAYAKPPGPGDAAWSEYNHNWSGLIVLVMGILALASRTGYAPWAKHWPLIFFALAVFLFLRSDPENWPLGDNGFWASFADPEVLQHRLAVLMVIAFAIFEWRVQTGRVASQSAALVFPAVGALGGALLMTHSHALGNIKQETLVELSHLPLGIFAVMAGWSRWLEIRLPADHPLRATLSRVWPVCFILIGAILLNYRET
jgi:putative copper resistance protein D